MSKRILLLVSTTSYRTEDFLAAAGKLGVEAVVGTDRCHVLADEWSEESFGTLQLEFRDLQKATSEIAARGPFAAMIPTDELTADLAARAGERLGLSGNSPAAAYTARNKAKMRAALKAAGVPCPEFSVHAIADEPPQVKFPCVLKPLLLSTSRGVIRADDREQLEAAWKRISALLDTPALRAVEDPDGHKILIESFVPGPEVALEGILHSGELEPIAIFDKPDPLDGPFFEETIYVTPSRHANEMQRAIVDVAGRAARAIGLTTGPIHAELRLGAGAPQVIEIAARSIGGLCARTLRFGLGNVSLEEVVIASALGLPRPTLNASVASGVMMIPIPRGGVFKAVSGVDEARQIAQVTDLVISAKIGQLLVPLPEGSSYLGFIFARATTPGEVESALRRAHQQLQFEIAPTLNRP